MCGTIKRGGEEEREWGEKRWGGESGRHAGGERRNAGEKVRRSETSRERGGGGWRREETLFLPEMCLRG